MSIKQPNHLASLLDKQSAAKTQLPISLMAQIRERQHITTELTAILTEVLPHSILTTCWVVAYTRTELTLCVESHTAANHIRYLKNDYINLLCKQSVTFNQLQNLYVTVAASVPTLPKKTHAQLTRNDTTKQLQANEYKGLNAKTRQTIAQAADHVIDDPALQNALLKLLEPSQ